MSPNPYRNAIIASAYIWGIGLFFQYMGAVYSNTPIPWTAPIAMLSLLVLSVALMGFLFFYAPAVLLLQNKKEEALLFFLTTLGTFAILTLIVALSVL
jgi:DMSO reductase anchor subunit